MGSIAIPIKVLLIDPNKEDREYWVERLTISSPAFSVLEADSGAAALAICQSQQIDCVVVEVTLPDMSGFQLLTRLIPRAFYPQIPVIVLSRLNLPPMRRLAINNGAQTYLLKSAVAGHELGWEIQKAIAAVAFQRARHSAWGRRSPADR
ncbi:MAG TPA: response regulator [Nitrospira sp.]|nr:response regulator [Nitrospira sp.]